MRRYRAGHPPGIRTGWALLCVLALGVAQAISYTVQVAALSDEGRALEVQQSLVQEGFAAYVLTVPTEQGLVYRLRVGAFANRAAAVRFAEALPPLSGNPATPALAQSIPQGLIPLEPELLGRAGLGGISAALFPWGDGAALRVALGNGVPVYYLPDGESIIAYHAVRRADGTALYLAPLPLWPEGLSAADRDLYRATVLVNVAASLGVSPAALAPYIVEPDGATPYLLVLEEERATGERRRLPALGTPGATLGALEWFGPRTSFAPPEPLWQLGSAPATQAQAEGEGWTAESDGAWVRVGLADAERRWRAVPGAPLAAAGPFLAVLDGEAVALYALRAP